MVAKLLAVVGTGITLIGVAFLLALAIQMGFFGPVARVTSGAMLAMGLVGAVFAVPLLAFINAFVQALQAKVPDEEMRA